MADTSVQAQFSLSPSDFKYLWEECKHCYYRKVKFKERQPSIGIPSIFTHMSGLLQDDLIGRRTHELHSDLPDGKFVRKEGFLKSQAILPSNQSTILGRFDLLTEFSDGSHGVIDVKMTDPRGDNLDKFDRQLHAYKFALENPLDGDGVAKVSTLGLVVVKPNLISLHKGKIFYRGNPVWHEIAVNMEGFNRFIAEVEALLNGSEPDPSPDCAWCQYRQG